MYDSESSLPAHDGHSSKRPGSFAGGRHRRRPAGAGYRDGGRYHGDRSTEEEPRPQAGRGELGAPLEQDRDRCERARSHARSRRRNARLRRAARARPREPRDGDRPHRDLRRRQRDRSPRTSSYSRLPAPPPAHVDGRGDRPGGARHARRAVPVADRRASTRCSRTTSRRFRDGRAKETRHRARAAGPPRRSSRWRANDGSDHAEPRMGVELRHRRPRRAMWRQDPISQLPVALGAHWGEVRPFVLRVGRAVPRAAAAGADERRVRGGVQRGEAPRRRRHRHADRAHAPTRPTPASTGPTTARRACARRRGSTTRSRCRSPTRWAPTSSSWRGCSRCVNVAMADAGIAIWESKYYYKLWRPVTGIREADAGTGRPAPATATRDTSATRRSRPLGAPASNLDGPELHAAVSRRIRPATPASAARSSRSCATFYGTDDIPFTFVSDEFNGVTRGQRRQRAAAAAAQLHVALRRPRRRTARAASTSASTGRSTRPRASPRAGASRTTCSPTRSRRGGPAGGRRPAGSRAA